MKVVVLGRGKVGQTLARALRERGVGVALSRGRVAPRDRRDRRGALYVLAVPDAALTRVSEQLAAQLSKRDVVLHCAGARGASTLQACSDAGAATGVLHPLVSFASLRALPSLSGATFVAQGSPRALRASRWLCRQLDAHCLAAPVIGPAYHAAAALLANGSASLAYSAQRILVMLGVPQRAAQRALAGLLTTVAVNVARIGVPSALTGPVARGDRGTVREHMRALTRLSPELARQYRQAQPIIEACAAALPDRARRQRPAAKRGLQRHK